MAFKERHQPLKYTLLTTEVVPTNLKGKGQMAKFCGRHLALAWFPIADLDKEKPQQIWLSGCALALLCLDQRNE